MTYVDGCILAVPKNKKKQYIEKCKSMAKFMKAQGAIEVVDAWEDYVPEGEITSMPAAVRKKDDEVVAFAYIVWPDKETRDKAAKAMRESSEIMDPSSYPFDGSRLIFGSFKKI